MPNKFHGQHSVWPIIKEQIRKTKKTQQIFAAIAYIGKDAPTLMPLRKGDLLVCNASDAAIKQGSTSARALEIFNKRGIKIFNESRLHGKVVVFSKRAFVGSANVSTRSKDVLYEAVVETTDQNIVDSSLRFVTNLAGEFSRLNLEDIRRLKRIAIDRTPPPPPPPPKRFVLPKQVPVLRLMPVYFGIHPPQVAGEIKKTRTSVRAHFFEGGTDAGIKAENWEREWWRYIEPGIWYIGVSKNGRMYTPQQMIKLSKVSKNQGILWLAQPLSAKKSAKDLELLSKLGFKWQMEWNDDPVTLKNKQTRALLKLFKED